MDVILRLYGCKWVRVTWDVPKWETALSMRQIWMIDNSQKTITLAEGIWACMVDNYHYIGVGMGGGMAPQPHSFYMHGDMQTHVCFNTLAEGILVQLVCMWEVPLCKCMPVCAHGSMQEACLTRSQRRGQPTSYTCRVEEVNWMGNWIQSVMELGLPPHSPVS